MYVLYILYMQTLHAATSDLLEAVPVPHSASCDRRGDDRIGHNSDPSSRTVLVRMVPEEQVYDSKIDSVTDIEQSKVIETEQAYTSDITEDTFDNDSTAGEQDYTVESTDINATRRDSDNTYRDSDNDNSQVSSNSNTDPSDSTIERATLSKVKGEHNNSNTDEELADSYEHTVSDVSLSDNTTHDTNSRPIDIVNSSDNNQNKVTDISGQIESKESDDSKKHTLRKSDH